MRVPILAVADFVEVVVDGSVVAVRVGRDDLVGADFPEDVKKNIFGIHFGTITADWNVPAGPGIFVAKLSNRGRAVWERLIVGKPVAIGDMHIGPFSYQIPVLNCVTWTITGSALAITTSLIPF